MINIKTFLSLNILRITIRPSKIISFYIITTKEIRKEKNIVSIHRLLSHNVIFQNNISLFQEVTFNIFEVPIKSSTVSISVSLVSKKVKCFINHSLYIINQTLIVCFVNLHEIN